MVEPCACCCYHERTCQHTQCLDASLDTKFDIRVETITNHACSLGVKVIPIIITCEHIHNSNQRSKHTYSAKMVCNMFCAGFPKTTSGSRLSALIIGDAMDPAPKSNHGYHPAIILLLNLSLPGRIEPSVGYVVSPLVRIK